MEDRRKQLECQTSSSAILSARLELSDFSRALLFKKFLQLASLSRSLSLAYDLHSALLSFSLHCDLETSSVRTCATIVTVIDSVFFSMYRAGNGESCGLIFVL